MGGVPKINARQDVDSKAKIKFGAVPQALHQSPLFRAAEGSLVCVTFFKALPLDCPRSSDG
jgi:hypothetical protein